MPHHFEAKTKTISDLFEGESKPILEIPRFQRGYSWAKKHVDAFWKDLVTFSAEKKAGIAEKYFLGPIVVLENEENRVEILDGQQRLATITIVFAALRNAAAAIGTEEFNALAEGIHSTYIAKMDAGDFKGFALQMGDMDKGFFSDTIQARTPKLLKPSITSHRLIQGAMKIIASNIGVALAPKSNEEKMTWMRELRNLVRQHLVMTSIPVVNEREAFQIFETLNDRGLRLSAPDLLLNYLMKKAEESDRKEIRLIWNSITERMGQRSIADFLRHVWVSRFGDLKKKDLFTALKEMIGDKGDVCLAYARQCSNLCAQYCAILDADEGELKANAAHVKNLNKLESDSALPLLLTSFGTLGESEFGDVCRWLLVFVVRHSIVAGMDAADMESLFFGLARDISKMREPENGIAPVDEPACLRHIKAELIKKSPSDGKLEESFEALTLTTAQATYMLSRIAEKMQGSTGELRLGTANLEHIFPQKPSTEWANADELEPFLWNIGNLTMLGSKINIRASNRGFAFKCEKYSQSSELEMAKKIARENSSWDAKAVERRAGQLGKWICQIWSFDNPSKV